MGRKIARFARRVADIDDADVVPLVEQQAADVEVPAVEIEGYSRRFAADRGRRVGLIVGHLVNGVGIAVGDTHDRYMGVEGVEIGDQREVHKSAHLLAWRDGVVPGHSSILHD